jgi:hypothetical protein
MTTSAYTTLVTNGMTATTISTFPLLTAENKIKAITPKTISSTTNATAGLMA